MVAFYGIATVELFTGQTLMQQAASPVGAAAALGLMAAVTAASLAPVLLGKVGPQAAFPSVNDSYPDRQLPSTWTAVAEQVNGCAAVHLERLPLAAGRSPPSSLLPPPHRPLPRSSWPPLPPLPSLSPPLAPAAAARQWWGSLDWLSPRPSAAPPCFSRLNARPQHNAPRMDGWRPPAASDSE
jgi:hypothetical protein